jgi:Hemerythrin HHE cation binding domain
MNPSVDLYTLPHKALRDAVGRAGTLLAAAEPATAAAALGVLADVLDDLDAHAAHEDEFIAPVLAAYLPDVEADIAGQHRSLTVTVGGVRRRLDRLAAAGEAPPGELLSLYRSFQRLAAANLVHLDDEETRAMPALWVAAPPDALSDVLARFRAAHPDAADLYRRWPDALTPHERRLVGVQGG